MDVQTCIDKYCELSREIFENKHRLEKIRDTFNFLGAKANFDQRILEDAIKQIVQDQVQAQRHVPEEGERTQQPASEGPKERERELIRDTPLLDTEGP